MSRKMTIKSILEKGIDPKKQPKQQKIPHLHTIIQWK